MCGACSCVHPSLLQAVGTPELESSAGDHKGSSDVAQAKDAVSVNLFCIKYVHC